MQLKGLQTQPQNNMLVAQEELCKGLKGLGRDL